MALESRTRAEHGRFPHAAGLRERVVWPWNDEREEVVAAGNAFSWRLVGITSVMPWLVKALFILAKTRRGRRLLFAAGLTVIELARGDRARKLYARAWTSVSDPAIRQGLTQNARRAAQAIRPPRA